MNEPSHLHVGRARYPGHRSLYVKPAPAPSVIPTRPRLSVRGKWVLVSLAVVLGVGMVGARFFKDLL